jgi:hypothetical protein
MHISEMIENANHAVTNIKVAHNSVLVALMSRNDFTPEQRVAIVEMFEPVQDAISVAQTKFFISTAVAE